MSYIYEHIRTQGYKPLHFEEHYARLEELSNKLFLSNLATDKSGLCKNIAEALRDGGYSPNRANAVCVKCYDDRTIEVECIDYLYNSFSLRALRPQGYIELVSGELITLNTSAKEAMLELNHTTAQIADKGVAIWANDNGEIVAIDGAAAVAVFDDEIRFSQLGSGVEFDLAYRAATMTKRRVTKGGIMVSELRSVKELLAIDYRGITAIAKYGEHLYMDITAERIAKQIASIEE